MTDPSRPDRSPVAPAPASGERPDLGRVADRLAESLTGSDVGSDTRAGSLAGGAATGSDRDPDQAAINRSLAVQGGRSGDAAAEAPPREGVNNTGDDVAAAGGEADAATG